MSNFIHPVIPGASVFFTVSLARRGATTLVDEIYALREALARTKAEQEFHVDALVVMPDHLHAVWTMPQGDSDYATRWSAIKSRFSRGLPAGVRRTNNVVRRERAVWQRGYREHHIQDSEDYETCLRYCIEDPVKHGFVQRPEDWSYSSVHRDTRSGRRAA